MPHTKFYADPLKNVAVRKEQKHTDTQTHTHTLREKDSVLYIYEMPKTGTVSR